ncbi:hypothetical protein ACVRYP_04795 [Streptococcus rifensis]
MVRSAILSQIASVNSSLTSANTKLSKLRAAKSSVAGVDLTLDYKVTDPGHLAGDAYDAQERNEKDILTNLKRDMMTKRSNVIADLDVKIAQAQTEVNGLNSRLLTLHLELEYATY